jgi:hypothetical protein
MFIYSEDKIRGIIMRTKAKWNVERERSSKYFCNLKKRHFTEKAIPKLILDFVPFLFLKDE